MRDSPVRRSFGLRMGDGVRALMGLVGAAAGFEVASWFVPHFDVGGPVQAVVIALLVSLFGLLLRPLLVRLSVFFGWVGTAAVGLLSQALIIWFVTFEAGDAERPTLLGTMVASWVVAAVSMTFSWVATAGTEDAATARQLRQARRRPVTVEDPEVPGVVFVQIDGVPFPVLDMAIRAGNVPTLSRWIRGGTHHLAEWRPKLPATTPASQMGILHGTIDGIPAFRWVDREERKVYVANKPADAALIEAKHSDGTGLLADDGVSVSNLFTGDAPTAYATMSAVQRTEETRETRLTLAGFLASPYGLARAIPRMLGEVLRERYQSRNAIRRDIRPRVPRGWGFVGERAGVVGVLRDLNAELVAQSMLKGRRTVYVDFVDYDAIAHHAGTLRPESLSALVAIDEILARLEQVAQVCPRPYHLVVLSDHGQSQGETFVDRYGEDLATLVARLADTGVVDASVNAEGAGALHAVVASSSDGSTLMGRALGRADARMSDRAFADSDRAEATVNLPHAERSSPDGDRFLVFGSGNLGLVYVAGGSHRFNRQELSDRYPALVPGLVAHPGVGFVVVDTADHGPVAMGARGENRLRENLVTGEDPLMPFGEHAAEFVLRAATMPEAPDIYVNSLVDDMGEVAAFEGLVSCHGGLGGWQDRAMVVWPDVLPGPTEMVVGADAVYRLFVGWLEHLGHRRDIRRRGQPPAQRPAESAPARSDHRGA